MMSPIIRLLTAEDSKEFYKIRLEGLETHPEAFGTGADDFRKATDEQVKDQLSKSAQNDFTVGAFDHGQLVGVVSFKREPKHSVRHKATVWGFFVIPSYRKQGLGKALLTKLIELANEIQGVDYLRAIVTVSNLNAGNTFKVLGFLEYGLEKNGIKEGSHYFDQSFVKLDLEK